MRYALSGGRRNGNLRAAVAAILASSTAISALAVPGAVHAEESGVADRPETIIVTGLREKQAGAGTKTGTPLLETPQTITVIDNEELTRRNALSINQAMGYVAGVAANQRGGMVTRYDQLVLRGFTPGVYLDGMRLLAGPYSMPQLDFNRIDHIDVVKGPASVLYGNSTPGGLVNLTSKLPQDVASGRIEGQIGNYGSFRGAADINQPLTADGKLRARGRRLAKIGRPYRGHLQRTLPHQPDGDVRARP